MGEAQLALDRVIGDCTSLSASLRQRTSKYIRSQRELDQVRTAGRAWFEMRRPPLAARLGDHSLTPVDAQFQWLMAATAHRTPRSAYRSKLAGVQRDLAKLQSEYAISLARAGGDPEPRAGQPPNFLPLVTSPEMRKILANRWRECNVCVAHGAPLAAAVMIGGLLEGLLLARVNSEDKSGRDQTFKCRSAPKDRSGSTKQLPEWKLHDFIAVAHERGWISSTVKDLGRTLRDYRNLIHPQKELSEAVIISGKDVELLWTIAKRMVEQIVMVGTAATLP